jgi:hypothetical protein
MSIESSVNGNSSRPDLWKEVQRLREINDHLQRDGNFKAQEIYSLKKALKSLRELLRLNRKELRIAKKVTKS